MTPNPPGAPKFTLPPVPPRLAGMGKQLLAEFEDVVRRTGEFSIHVGDSMRANPKEASKFIQAAVEATVVLFQKWNLEILYLLALAQKMRFSQLKEILSGISSRTLSLKLGELEEQGLVNREVFPGRPLRVEYSLTDNGRTLARLTVPMVTFVNLLHGMKLGD